MTANTRSQYEKYVVDVQTARRLAGCGFKHDCMFYWAGSPELGNYHLYRTGIDMEYIGPLEHRLAAPTAAEVKELIPDEIWISVNNNRSHLRRPGVFHFIRHNGKYVVSLVLRSEDTGSYYEVHREEDANEATAVGLMYCFIHENGLHELRPSTTLQSTASEESPQLQNG